MGISEPMGIHDENIFENHNPQGQGRCERSKYEMESKRSQVRALKEIKVQL